MTNTIERVFLDLDDTLNSYTLYVLGLLGANIGPFDYHKYPPVGYDIVTALNVLTGRKLTAAEFWSNIPREYWSQAPRAREFDTIVKFCERLVGLENTYILTSPTLCPESCAGKLEWIQREWPKPRNYFLGPAKSVIARPGYLLIDDISRHLDPWAAAGGDIISIPRPWNDYNDFSSKDFGLKWCSDTRLVYRGDTHETRISATGSHLQQQV